MVGRSEDENNTTKQKGRRRFAVSWFFVRYYNTSLFLLVIVAGVRNWWLAGALFCLGLGCDWYRRKTSPELRDGEDRLAQFHAWASHRKHELKPGIKRYFILYCSVWLLGLLYVITIVTLSHYISDNSFSQYFEKTDWLVTAGSYFFPLIQDHMTQMQGMGLQFRAALVGHLYAFSGFYFIVTIVIFSFRLLSFVVLYFKYEGEVRLQKVLMEKPSEEKLRIEWLKMWRGVFLILPFVIFVYLLCMSLDFQTSEGVAHRFLNVTDWNIGISDRPIFAYFIFMLIGNFLMISCYPFAYLFVCEHKKLSIQFEGA